MLALIHLYCTDPHKSFSSEDLEFTIAVAKHLAIVMGQMLRQDSLTLENQSLREQLQVESELVGDSPADQERFTSRSAGSRRPTRRC